MIDFKFEQTDDKKTLIINGELTIQNASALQNILIESLVGAEHLTLNLENVTEIDLSCLQLLCSIQRTTTESNKSFTLSSNCPEVFKEAVRNAGYLRHDGCTSDCDTNCLWIEMNI